MVEQEFMYDLEKVRTNKNSSEYLPDNLADLQLSCDHAAYIRSKNKQSDLEDLHLHVVQFHELFRSKLSRYDKGFRIQEPFSRVSRLIIFPWWGPLLFLQVSLFPLLLSPE